MHVSQAVDFLDGFFLDLSQRRVSCLSLYSIDFLLSLSCNSWFYGRIRASRGETDVMYTWGPEFILDAEFHPFADAHKLSFLHIFLPKASTMSKHVLFDGSLDCEIGKLVLDWR